MAAWKDLLYRLANQSEHHFDELLIRFREHMGWKTNVHIQTFNSFGSANSLLVKGRVLHFRDTKPATHDSVWDNLADMYRRFNTHEIKNALLSVKYNNYQAEIFSDEDGYFEKVIPYSHGDDNHQLWHHPSVELLDSPVAFKKPLQKNAAVMVPPVTASFGVISDIDDTILPTHAVKLLKSMYTTFSSNAYSRIPFEGVPEFYRALQYGKNGNQNPVLYVSSSPWNLYDFITDFFTINNIPPGPVLLKDYGFTHNKFFSEGHLEHKQKIISLILRTYPFLPFILIGDSGQHDPEIYASVIKNFPGRILAVVIRDVTPGKRNAEIKKIYDAPGHAVPLILSPATYAAHDFCINRGWIK